MDELLRMRPRRIRLPIALIVALSLTIGLGVLQVSREISRKSAGRDALPTTGEVFGSAPGNFADLPTADSADDRISTAEPAGGTTLAGSTLALGNLRKRMSAKAEDLPVIAHPDGRRSVHLGGRFMHMSAVVNGPDGNPVVRCFSDFDELTAALSRTPNAPKPDVSR